MENNFIEKYIKISRIIIILLVFIVLNWLWNTMILSIIISAVVFFINSPSSKICIFLINKGDEIENKILRVLYYILALPIIFFLVLIAVEWLGIFGVALIENPLNLGLAIRIVYIGIGIFTCILVPYFQTLIILMLRHFLNLRDETNGKN